MKFLKYLTFLIILSGCASAPSSTQNDAHSEAKDEKLFAFDLLKQVSEDGENVFFSPYSISSALAMTYTGAEGTTKEEMQKVFGFAEDKQSLAKEYGMVMNHLDTVDSDDITITVANSLWCQEGYDFLDDFLSINSKYYEAGIKKADFRNNTEEARRNINDWVEEQTNNRITDLIQEGVLTPAVRLVLANAIYFKGFWEHPFEKQRTEEDTFYEGKGGKKQALFMNQAVSVNYFEDELAQVVELPYAGKALSMMIILPQKVDGIEQLISELDASLYHKYLDAMFTKKVDLAIPRFKSETRYNLNEPLQVLGMKSAFGRRADFSGMTGNKELFLSDVAHKAFIEVNEEGTEAAAATGAVMSKTSLVKKVEFKANHPFVYLIKDNHSNTILFMGRMSDPVNR